MIVYSHAVPFDGVQNQTLMTVRCLPMVDRHGQDVMVAVAKIAYAVSPAGAVTLAPPPIVRLFDVATSDAARSSLRFASDMVDDKPGTDVVMVGTAHPPAGSAATSVDVALRIGRAGKPLGKLVRVHGPRVWYQGVRGVVPGPAAWLEPTPLIYELAFGGVDDESAEAPVVDWRNPSGSGVAADRATLIGRAAPQIEDPGAPLDSSEPAPAGFGPIASSWLPRARLAGTYDERWRRERAPVRPLDFDPRHNSVAHPDLWTATPLAGTEPVEVLNATADGAWCFALPAYAPEIRAVMRGIVTKLGTHLDTLHIDADRRTVELSWRASIPMPRKLEQLDAVVVSTSDELPERVFAAGSA
jgi:hypothetical protein